jgi:hypothetical protein
MKLSDLTFSGGTVGQGWKSRNQAQKELASLTIEDILFAFSTGDGATALDHDSCRVAIGVGSDARMTNSDRGG